jgi:hypothetical protein
MLGVMMEMQRLMMKMMPNPPRIPMVVKIDAPLLVPHLDPFWR